jgi:hypothetical protein
MAYVAPIAAYLGVSTAVVLAVEQILVNVLLGVLIRKLSKRNEGGAPELNITLRTTIEPRHIVLGTRRTAGVLAFYGTSSSGGATKDYLWYVIVMAGHQCSAMGDVYLDVEKILNSDINAGTGAVTGGKFSGKASIWKHLGTSAQTVDTNVDSAFTEWDTNHKLAGCAYIVVRLQRDDAVYQGGAPQSITTITDGALCYDPRKDSTNGGAGTHRMSDPSTWQFSRNPPLHARWIISGGSVTNDTGTRMIKYGLREDDTRIDDAAIIAAANHCDEVLSGANAPPSGSQTRYYCDGEFTCGENRRDILNAILASMAGTLVVVKGKWTLYAGVYQTPVHTLTQDDLFDGDLDIQDTTPRSERYNAVSATYVDAANLYQDATTILRTDSTYETQDGGEQIPKDPPLDLRAVVGSEQAQRLAEIDKRLSRMMRTVKLPGSLNLLKIAPYEGIVFSHARYSWTNRVFRCRERRADTVAGAGQVTITAVRDDPGVWTDMVTADYTSGTSSTGTFTNDGPDAPTGLTTTAVPSGILFKVTMPSFFAAGSAIEIWEHTASTPFSSATLVASIRSDTIILTRRDTTTRYYWTRVRDQRGAVSSTFPASTGQAAAAGLVAGTAVTQSPADGNTVYTVGTQPRIETGGITGHVTYTAPAGITTGVQLSWSAQAQVSNSTSGVAVGYAAIQARIFVNGVQVFIIDCNLDGATTATGVWGTLAGSRTVNINGGDTIDLYLDSLRIFSTSGSSPAQTMYWRAALLDLLPLNG